MPKHSDDFARKLREEKKSATVPELASKYKISKNAVTYLIYMKKLQPIPGIAQPLYQELEEASQELKKQNTIIQRILKALGR